MQRKAYAAGAALVALLVTGTVACTGDSDSGEGSTGGTPGTAAGEASPAPPGTYRDLPEPCGTVDTALLRTMLPGAGGASPAEDDGGETPEAYEGERALTYDADRRVGCSWKSSTGLGSRHLTIDFERVVSYDSAVSDNDRAELLYEERASEAGIPAPEPGGGETADAGENGEAGGAEQSARAGEPGEAGDDESPEGSGEPEEPDASDEPGDVPSTGADPDVEPRALDGIGDAAYIDDELATADAGAHRDITLVFRTANVIVTVRYEQWVADERLLPDSAELQERAQELAGRLAGEFDD